MPGVPVWSLVVVGALAFAGGRWLWPAVEVGEGPSLRPVTQEAARVPEARPAGAVSTPEPAVAGPSGPEPEAPLRLLQRCSARLETLQKRCTGQEAISVEACLADPEVRAACASPPGVEPAAGTPSETDGEEPDDRPPSTVDESFAQAFATSVVGVDDGDARWLETYLCTVHQLREQMLGDLRTLLAEGAPAGEVDALIADANQQRKAVLGDLEQQLGAERYGRLRSVGGLGIMGAALECAAEP